MMEAFVSVGLTFRPFTNHYKFVVVAVAQQCDENIVNELNRKQKKVQEMLKNEMKEMCQMQIKNFD